MESPERWLRGYFDKWRLIFLIFLVIYAALLLVNLGGMPVQWDEATHLNGGMLLLRGNFHEYLDSNAFYPPMYDLFAAGFFSMGGISVFMGRLVSLTFSLLSIYVVFEFGRRLYGAKTALVASVFFAVMPGYIWLSRMAMIETMLVFFFTVSALSFFWWLQKQRSKFLILSMVMLVSGILVKYQMLIVGIIMLAGLVFLGRDYLKKKLPRFSVLLLVATAIAVPLVVLFYLIASHTLNAWLYALEIGTSDKLLYGMGLNSVGLPRFPSWYYAAPSWVQTPIFYFLEMTVPYYDVHPVSFVLYVFGVAGMVFIAWRRKPEDKYLLIWFIVVYVFFTAIPNKDWRYVVLLFPVLALSAACLLSSALIMLKELWGSSYVRINRKRFLQVSAILLVSVVALGTAFSVVDAFTWESRESIHIPVQESADFVGFHLAGNESVMVMLSQNLFSAEMVQFYLRSIGKGNAVYQYPELAADAYTPDFDIATFVSQCRAYNVKYVLMYEYGADVPYFNTTLTFMDVYQQLNETGDFGNLPMQLSNGTIASGIVFGESPHQIYVITFLG